MNSDVAWLHVGSVENSDNHMVCAVGHISGGHFNPAVTFGFWITKRLPTLDAAAYWVGQFAAAILAALLLKAALPVEGTLGRTVPGPGVGDGQALLVEFILTFFLGWVIFAVAVDDRGSLGIVAGLPIGFVIVFDILMGGPLTGASMATALTAAGGAVDALVGDVLAGYAAELE